MSKSKSKISSVRTCLVLDLGECNLETRQAVAKSQPNKPLISQITRIPGEQLESVVLDPRPSAPSAVKVRVFTGDSDEPQCNEQLGFPVLCVLHASAVPLRSTNFAENME